MLKVDAIKFFGNNTKVAEIAGVDRSAVSQWKDLVPEARARRLEEASNGALHYNKDIYDQHRKARRLEKQTSTRSL